MESAVTRELDYLRIGMLTYYILRVVDGLPKVDMHPYYALISQELQNQNRLGAGKSLLYKRLQQLQENGFLISEAGASANPKAKKKVQFFSLTEQGRELLRGLEAEQLRIIESLRAYSLK